MRDVARMLLELHTHVVRLDRHLHRIDERVKEIQMSQSVSLAILKRIDTATTNIAADLRRLKDKTEDPAVVAGLESAASRLEAMANDPENPDPEEPPVEDPGA